MADRPLSMLERLEHRVVRSLLRLPPPAQVLLAGGRPIRRDGLTLHPEMQLLLALRKRTGARPLSHGKPEEARRRLRREALKHAGRPPEVGAVRNVVVEAPHRPLMTRLYLPAEVTRAEATHGPAERPPLLVFFHGGGFALGDLDTHDVTCRLLCGKGRMGVLSVEYALAPEAPFPAALEDGRSALDWAVANAEALGLDPRRVAVGGDSAGGGLAAVISLFGVKGEGPLPAAQFLLYPTVDRTVDRPSLSLFAEDFFLTRTDIDWFSEKYCAGADCADPRISPLRAESFEGLPPTMVVTAGFDPLRDEGEAYAGRLREAGVRVSLRRFDSLIHGFATMTGVSPVCETAVVELAAQLRQMLSDSEVRG